MAGSPTDVSPRSNEVAGSLAASVRLRHPGRAAEALLERQSETWIAAALAELADRRLGLRTVGREQQAFAVELGSEEIVDVERDRGSRRRPIFNERGRVRAAVPVGVDLICPEEAEPVATVD